MKKYATSVILQSYSGSKSGRTGTQRAPSPKTDGPVVVAPPSTRGRPVATDPSRGFPSPKSSHVSTVKGQRRSPFPDYHEEHQTWLSLSGNEHIQSADAAEQQSAVLSSVVLEPEDYHKLKKLVEDQKHQQSSSRPLNKSSSTGAPVVSATSTTPVMGPPSTPNKALLDDRLNTSVASNNNGNNSMNLGAMLHASDDHHQHAHHHPHGYQSADDDGAMSDRTQATAQLWSQSHPSHANDTKDTPLDTHTTIVPMEDSVLSSMTIDEIMQMQMRLQREMERRARAATTPQNVASNASSSASMMPPPVPASGASPASVPVLTGSPFTVSNNNNSFIDTQAVESRKAFKRSKSGGNESAFNTMISITTTSASSSRARTPVSNIGAATNSSAMSSTSNTANNGSKLMSNFMMMAGSNHKLDLQAVEREDPELLSVHRDVTNSNNTPANLHSHTPSYINYNVNNTANNSSTNAHVPYYAASGNAAHSVVPQTSFQQVNGTGSSSTGKSGQARPVSRTNGALHPHDKMLYGHRNTALPCLSPMDQQPNAYAASSPVLSFSWNTNSNDGFYYYNNNLNNFNSTATGPSNNSNNMINQSSRSSSRAPSRGVVLANFEDRLNNPAAITPLANHSNRSQSLGGSSFTASALSLDEVMIPIEAVNISSVSNTNNNTNSHSNNNNEMTLDQFLSANRPSSSFAFFSNGSVTNHHNVQREISRSELTVSPHCAFDDRSQGSQSVTSSISSRQQKQQRHPSKRSSQRQSRRESTQTTTSNGTVSSNASVVLTSR